MRSAIAILLAAFVAAEDDFECEFWKETYSAQYNCDLDTFTCSCVGAPEEGPCEGLSASQQVAMPAKYSAPDGDLWKKSSCKDEDLPGYDAPLESAEVESADSKSDTEDHCASHDNHDGHDHGECDSAASLASYSAIAVAALAAIAN